MRFLNTIKMGLESWRRRLIAAVNHGTHLSNNRNSSFFLLPLKKKKSPALRRNRETMDADPFSEQREKRRFGCNKVWLVILRNHRQFFQSFFFFFPPFLSLDTEMRKDGRRQEEGNYMPRVGMAWRSGARQPPLYTLLPADQLSSLGRPRWAQASFEEMITDSRNQRTHASQTTQIHPSKPPPLFSTPSFS